MLENNAIVNQLLQTMCLTEYRYQTYIVIVISARLIGVIDELLLSSAAIL